MSIMWVQMVWEQGMKPPYRVPTMDEIRSIEPSGLTVASTFSGCGGSSLGYRMAGLTVVYANEFIEEARSTYTRNCDSRTIVDPRDIRDVSGADILSSTMIDIGDLDILDGSPPCSAFSMCGKREAGWGVEGKYSSTTQRVDDLFFEFARIVNEVKPEARRTCLGRPHKACV